MMEEDRSSSVEGLNAAGMSIAGDTGINPVTSNHMQVNEQPHNFNIKPQPEIPTEEKDHIKKLESKASDDGMKVGQIWYVVSSRWWKQWKDYVAYDWYSSIDQNRPKPPPIDNSNLLEEGDEDKIKKNCMENYDYVIVSEEIWFTLHSWYGGGPALPRKAISAGWQGSSYVVEVRPLQLKVCKSSAITEYINASFSKSDTVGTFKKVMCQKMNLDPEQVRVWDYHANSKYKLLDDMKAKLESAQIIDSQPMLIEEKDENGKFPEIQKSRMGGYNSSSYYNSNVPTDPGCTGLVNLGNTCFMNSSLQCLSNTLPLIDYFRTDKYKDDVNTDNPLGMKGEIAEEYANLIKELWAGTHSSVAPRDLKYKIERFAPQFAGYQQHDSQELLAFLLDGLHEDLNRIKKKPYIENPEVDNRPEAEVAKEAWTKHKSRNDSIIVDYFQGQLKSTLNCPVCDKISITFDPFMHLSLPLPMKNTRTIKATVYYLDPLKKPLKLACDVVKYASIKDFKVAVSALCGAEADRLVVTDVYNGRFFKQFSDHESIDSIQDRDVINIYELLVPLPEEEIKEKNKDKMKVKQEQKENDNSNNDVMFFPVVHRKEESISQSYHSSNFSKKSLFGIPFVLTVQNASKLTYAKLYELIYTQIQRYLKDVPKGKIIRTTDDLKDDSISSGTTSSSNNITPSNSSSSKSKKNASDEEMSDQDIEVDKRERESSPDSDEERRNYSVKKRKALPLFTIKAVDTHGSSDQDVLIDNDKPLKIDNKQTLAIHWQENLAERFYNDRAENDIELHSSLAKPEEKELDDSISLDKCIDLFTSIEKLGPEDPWYCSKCKEFRQATKKFDLWKLPPVLVVHLKRFSYKNRYWREKLETFVDYPISGLDLSNAVKGPQEVPPVYDLYAVSNHFGSLGGGHYVAYAKNKNDKNWYKFDDSSVSKQEESKAKTSSAYVLFYVRRDILAANGNSNGSVTPSSNPSSNSDDQNSGANGLSDDTQAEPMDDGNGNSEMETK